MTTALISQIVVVSVILLSFCEGLPYHLENRDNVELRYRHKPSKKTDVFYSLLDRLMADTTDIDVGDLEQLDKVARQRSARACFIDPSLCIKPEPPAATAVIIRSNEFEPRTPKVVTRAKTISRYG